jgi:tetratricopeptide (TPR) repeat protein
VQLELDNIRAALAWSIEHGQGALGLTLVEALEPFWYRRAQFREGLRWLEPLLELAADAPVDVRAGAFGLGGRLASELNSVERARPWYEESLTLARAAGDRLREAWALHGLGFVSALEGDRSRGRELLEQSYELFVELEQHGPAGGRLTYLAWVAQLEGDIAAMRACLERAVAEYRTAGDASGVTGTLAGLGDAALEEDDWAAALGFYRAALSDASEPRVYMALFAGIGAVAARTGHPAEAARLWGAAERIESEIESKFTASDRALFERNLRALDADDLAAGRALSTDEAVALAHELTAAVSPTR